MMISRRLGDGVPTFDMLTEVAISRSMGRRLCASTVTDDDDKLSAAAAMSPLQRNVSVMRV
jgi:hypothetical protein